MIGGRQRIFVAPRGEWSAPCLQRAVVQLAEAHDYGQDGEVEPWQYAVEIESLFAVGATESDLRWLVEGGYVEHAREVTGPRDLSRRFMASRGSKFSKRACFVLTEAGLRLTCATTPEQMPLRRAA